MIKRRDFIKAAGSLALVPLSLVSLVEDSKSQKATPTPTPTPTPASTGTGSTYVIAEPCIGTTDTACVDVCPVDCIHPRKDEDGFTAGQQLFIDPEICIGCGLCEPACPVQAIFPVEHIPEQYKHFIQINADYYKKKQNPKL